MEVAKANYNSSFTQVVPKAWKLSYSQNVEEFVLNFVIWAQFIIFFFMSFNYINSRCVGV